jgi:hypothetical protein
MRWGSGSRPSGWVRLESYPPGASRPQPLTVPVVQFNALAKVGEMTSILVATVTAGHTDARQSRRRLVGISNSCVVAQP